MKLIDKDALVAEIDRRINELYDLLPDASKVENGSITTSEACNTGKYTALESFRRFIDTLEVKEVDTNQLTKLLNWWKDVTTEHSVYKVKEVDLEKSISDWLFEEGLPNEEGLIDYIKETAEHFFELGMSVRNKAQKGDK